MTKNISNLSRFHIDDDDDDDDYYYYYYNGDLTTILKEGFTND